MDRPRLALINAAYSDESTRKNFRREIPADLVEFHVIEGKFPETFDFDGVVVTGSRASVYWDEPWIDDMLEWLDEAVSRGLPCLGICFGHQALAEVLGGTVESMGEYEIGYRVINRVKESRLLDGLDDQMIAFTTHQDAVTELPEGATLTAENEYGIHGFERDTVFTVQFHPEYDMATAKRVTEGKDLPKEQFEAVMEGITEENYAKACETKRLFDTFVEIVKETMGEVDVPIR